MLQNSHSIQRFSQPVPLRIYQKLFHHQRGLGMKNAILPSVSSQLSSYGNSEPLSDIPVQMDSIVNVYGNSFCTDPAALYNDCSDSYNQLREGGVAIIPPQSTIDYQPGPSSLTTIKRLDYPYFGEGYLTTASTHVDIPLQHSLSLSKKLQHYETDFQATDAKKRSIEVRDGEFSSLVGNNATLSEWMTNKKALCFQEQWRHQVKEELKDIQRQRVPVRRSQKLSDRITALQKLVSPYGKTDTASVLQEASISIKVLQGQIQKLFRMLSASYASTRPFDLQKSGDQKQLLDLRSRGLCLVPVSFTQELTKEDQVDQ